MANDPTPDIDDDVRTLAAMGYAQELQRRIGGFSNYCISLSIICILAGGVTSFPVGLCSAGGASVGLGWPLVSLLALAFAATMAQVASAFPTAGGLYHWASILGGRGWGWATAWFNLAGLITVLAAINLATVQFAFGAFAPASGFTAAEAGHWLSTLVGSTPVHEFLSPSADGRLSMLVIQLVAVALLTASQAGLNHLGIRTTTRLTDASGSLILLVAAALTVSLLVWAPSLHPLRLITLSNSTGLPAAEPVWPATASTAWAFALGLLLPAYTITGFDASAHASEETIGASREVPRAIIRAVVVSALFGWIMLAALVMAIPDIDAAVAQGGNAFFWTLEELLPAPLRSTLLGGILVAQYCCGLATVTSASRMLFAFARDGGLPWSKTLRRVSPIHHTPAIAIWVVASLAVVVTGLVPYLAITAVCVILLYVSYLMPTLSGLLAWGRSWTRMGPWSLGRWYRPLAVICLAGGGALFVIGVQPPNEFALRLVPGLAAVLGAWWFLHKRHHFPGPPSVILRSTGAPGDS
ncbi:MAG: amino acid permease [Planctomycetota bacterium]|nr:MAG: amino acid permease [Planctomycetota bacterium]